MHQFSDAMFEFTYSWKSKFSAHPFGAVVRRFVDKRHVCGRPTTPPVHTWPDTVVVTDQVFLYYIPLKA